MRLPFIVCFPNVPPSVGHGTFLTTVRVIAIRPFHLAPPREYLPR
jgi:hypothetical protein